MQEAIKVESSNIEMKTPLDGAFIERLKFIFGIPYLEDMAPIKNKPRTCEDRKAGSQRR